MVLPLDRALTVVNSFVFLYLLACLSILSSQVPATHINLKPIFSEASTHHNQNFWPLRGSKYV